MSDETLKEVLRLAQDLRKITPFQPPLSASPPSALSLSQLSLPPAPSLAPQLEKFGLTNSIQQALQDVFARRVEDLRSSTRAAFQDRLPAIRDSLLALQQDSDDLFIGERILTSTRDHVSTQFLSKVGSLGEALVRRVRDSIDQDRIGPKTAPTFSKDCIETLRKIYLINSYPNPAEIRVIAEKISMDYKQVRVWFQNRRNRKAVSARGIKEELRIAAEHGIVPPKSHAQQAKLAQQLSTASTQKQTVKKKHAAVGSQKKQSQRSAAPVVAIRHETAHYDSCDSGGGMDVDNVVGSSVRPFDNITFDFHDPSSLGYGRPPQHHPHGHSVSPAPQSASTSTISFSTQPPPSSSQFPSGSWSYDTPDGSPSQEITPEDHWNLVPVQPSYYMHQAQSDGSLLPPTLQQQRSSSFGSSCSSSSLSDLDSLWSIASTDPATTYSTFSSAPCVPTDLDFTPPAPSDESTLEDPLFEPAEYLLSSTIPAFSFSPSPQPAADPAAMADFSAEAFQALLDSTSGTGPGGADGGGIADGALWGNDSVVLELSEEIDQVLREFTPEGGESFSLFDFNIPAPAAAW